MTRIVGGRARGRRLAVPDVGTRPTSDRAREAVFSSLESLRGTLEGARVLDLYAGSGALGLEALSRGASLVELVESDRRAAQVIEANRSAVEGLSPPSGVARVQAVSVERWMARSTPESHLGSRFDVIFCDPPYAVAADEVSKVLVGLLRRALLAEDASLVVERSRRDPPWAWPPGFVPVRDRVYGDAHLWIGGLAAAPAAASSAAPAGSDSVAPC